MAPSNPAQPRAPFASAPLLLAACLVSAGLTSCNDDDDMGPTGPAASLSSIDTSGSMDGIVELPASVDSRITAVFDRYTQVTAPNGGRINFLSQDAVSDDLLIRTRGMVLQHYFDAVSYTHLTLPTIYSV